MKKLRGKYFFARKKVIHTRGAKKFYARAKVTDNCIRLRSTFRRHEPRGRDSRESERSRSAQNMAKKKATKKATKAKKPAAKKKAKKAAKKR